jgi:hypothetical protein
MDLRQESLFFDFICSVVFWQLKSIIGYLPTGGDSASTHTSGVLRFWSASQFVNEDSSSGELPYFQISFTTHLNFQE